MKQSENVSPVIIDFLDTNNILHRQQFGFRKNRSASYAAILLVEKVAIT